MYAERSVSSLSGRSVTCKVGGSDDGAKCFVHPLRRRAADTYSIGMRPGRQLRHEHALALQTAALDAMM